MARWLLSPCPRRQRSRRKRHQCNGAIAGVIDTGSASHAGLYSAGAWTDLGAVSGAVSTQATSINASGEIVGLAVFPKTGSYKKPIAGKRVAFIYKSGALVDLNTLVSPGSGLTIGGNPPREASKSTTPVRSSVPPRPPPASITPFLPHFELSSSERSRRRATRRPSPSRASPRRSRWVGAKPGRSMAIAVCKARDATIPPGRQKRRDARPVHTRAAYSCDHGRARPTDVPRRVCRAVSGIRRMSVDAVQSVTD